MADPPFPFASLFHFFASSIAFHWHQRAECIFSFNKADQADKRRAKSALALIGWCRMLLTSAHTYILALVAPDDLFQIRSSLNEVVVVVVLIIIGAPAKDAKLMVIVLHYCTGSRWARVPVACKWRNKRSPGTPYEREREEAHSLRCEGEAAIDRAREPARGCLARLLEKPPSSKNTPRKLWQLSQSKTHCGSTLVAAAAASCAIPLASR